MSDDHDDKPQQARVGVDLAMEGGEGGGTITGSTLFIPDEGAPTCCGVCLVGWMTEQACRSIACSLIKADGAEQGRLAATALADAAARGLVNTACIEEDPDVAEEALAVWIKHFTKLYRQRVAEVLAAVAAAKAGKELPKPTHPRGGRA